MKRLELEEAAIFCRGLGHAWDAFNPPVDRMPSVAKTLKMPFRCVRCGTERHDAIEFDGQLWRRKYVYPDGYKSTGLARPEVRLTMRRLIRSYNKRSTDLRVMKEA